MTGNSPPKTAAIIVAAGSGTRAGGDIAKQWQVVAGRRVIDWALSAFAEHPKIDEIVVVTQPANFSSLTGATCVAGGETRAASVRAGLNALTGRGVEQVLIHDAARPAISGALITRVLGALGQYDGAAPGVAVTDALWRVEDTQITGGADRDGLARAQTPQAFRFDKLVHAHRTATGTEPDDVAVALAAGLDVVMVAGDEDNIKVTTPPDFERAAAILGKNMDIRLGNGFDVHRFGPGDQVILCGVPVPHERGLQGHSDADVGMHALTDAIYGALAEGDIGRHFPPSDPQWKGAASDIFLTHAAQLARDRGFRLANADVTLICEFPKITPHAPAMQAKLAGILKTDTDRISVKATTSEKLGFTGRGEGIAAIATATLVSL